MEYRFVTDSCSVTIEAANADEAARQFVEDDGEARDGIKGVTSLATLLAHLARTGGYATVSDDGGPLGRIDPNTGVVTLY